MRRIALFLFAPLLAAAAPRGARAADDLASFKAMSPELALDLARAALQDCRQRGFQVAVAVVDRSGTLQVLLRDTLAGPHTPDAALGKARAAVSFRTPSSELAASTQPGQPNSGLRALVGYVFAGGGLQAEAAGQTVGGIGISGAPGGAEDEACARAGLAAVEDRLMM